MPLSFVSVAATPTLTPRRATVGLSAISTAAAIPVTLAAAPQRDDAAVMSGEDEAGIDIDTPLLAERATLTADDILPQVHAHAAPLDIPPPPEPSDSLDIGPMSSELDELDISDFDFSAADDEADGASAAQNGGEQSPHVLNPAASTEDEDERDETAPKYRAVHEEPAPLPSSLPQIVVRHDELLSTSADDDQDPQEEDNTGPRPLDDVPTVLRDDLAALSAAPRAPVWRGLAWSVFALLLAASAALQLAFIEREAVLAQMPQAVPLIDALCARLPCLERRQAASSVRLLARDVREHPSYRDALLVNATIVNDAATPSPYPVIDLRLRDAAGNVLSARQFKPSEYLDQSIDIAAGMPAARPVYIVLELAGNASNAVSFEFTFL